MKAIIAAVLLAASFSGAAVNAPATQPATQPMYPLLPMPQSRLPASDEVAELRAMVRQLAAENAVLRSQLAAARGETTPPAADSSRGSSPSASSGEPQGDAGTTPRGFQKYTGPRGGVYHISKNGNKVYEKRR